MARPRAATDEQIIEAAEELARELGWRKVYGSTVRDRMAVGGSPSTFIKVVNAWRAQREATEETGPNQNVAEVVGDRASVLDDGLSAIAATLKSLRDVVNAEIDRAVADERRKSDRLRADDRAAHEAAAADLRGQIATLASENEALATEAIAEAERADAAEIALDGARGEIAAASTQIDVLGAEAAKVPDLEGRLAVALQERQQMEAAAQAQLRKAEERESVALKTVDKRDRKVEALEQELVGLKADLATARSDLSDARTESVRAHEALAAATARSDDLKAGVEKERERGDSAWARVEILQTQLESLADRIPQLEAIVP
jgi:DNA repair exonuclease SbcCD ATPase subunit